MVGDKLVSRLTLDNGLTLEIWDRSRRVAGDRWQVTMEARIRIPVSEEWLAGDNRLGVADIQAALGPEVMFGHSKVRNFIDAAKAQEVFEGLKGRFLQTAQTYLGHQDFPARFIRKKFAEYQETQSWRQP